MNNINNYMLENYIEKVFREAGYLVQSEMIEIDQSMLILLLKRTNKVLC